MHFKRWMRRLVGLDRNGSAIDTPSFTVDGKKVIWTCHVCDERLRVPYLRKRKIKATCPVCSTRRIITRGRLKPVRPLFSRPPKTVFVTRATLNELEAKKKMARGFEVNIPIRRRLVYHIEYTCAYAHKDYEEDGVLVAYNTGVVESVYHSWLAVCKPCRNLKLVGCSRCKGKGVIPRFSHVRKGICFKCWGRGYTEHQ